MRKLDNFNFNLMISRTELRLQNDLNDMKKDRLTTKEFQVEFGDVIKAEKFYHLFVSMSRLGAIYNVDKKITL
jgi:hypothetical protein